MAIAGTKLYYYIDRMRIWHMLDGHGVMDGLLRTGTESDDRLIDWAVDWAIDWLIIVYVYTRNNTYVQLVEYSLYCYIVISSLDDVLKS
jgi:hypothetical protein